MHKPLSFYESEAVRWEAAVQASSRREQLISRLRLLIALIAIGSVFFALEMGSRLIWAIPALAAVGFAALVRAAIRQERITRIAGARLQIARRELLALGGDFSGAPAGAQYADVTHPFSFDLDLFGSRSIFQMLCRCVSLAGLDLLAGRLRNPDLNKSAIEARQEAIRELAAGPESGCEFRASGMLVAEREDELGQVRDWLRAADEFRNRPLIRVAAAVMPLLAVAGVIVSLWQETMHPALNLVIAMNALLWGLQLKRIKRQNRLLGRHSTVIAKYTALLEHPAGMTFRSLLLRKISASARETLVQLREFNRLVGRFDSRNNGMAGSLMNVLFLHDFRCLLKLEAWRAGNNSLLETALKDLALFDELNALGSYAFLHPGYHYPEMNETGRCISATGLRHPLLPETSAVGNTFTLGQNEQLYLLTGANMTGKSTFIRTVGVSLILGQLGLPIAAECATLPLLKLYTSIRISDSIQEDVSYFRAELERIRSLFDAVHAHGGNYLVLIDEPLRGTNSGDKQQGTRAIIRRLLSEGVTAVVATHDTALSQLENESGGKLKNYHFESRVADGILRFDFKLRPGPSTSANASLLMQQMGIV